MTKPTSDRQRARRLDGIGRSRKAFLIKLATKSWYDTSIRSQPAGSIRSGPERQSHA
ncbi:MAG: hypothetical protein ABIQ36_02910 [Rhodanobacter sp.]